ncbi:hypothetical protein L0668_15035 [Paraglaciecola aquimarina]|uniref:C2H2-type domain-containing protein n=1 Tax=Paraglaciecola algarum TaxID=3050085 RepID=A0ABS9DBP6_9ALTE|nr:hypothetical protein [Paraglaciecola sp. G1-23]MCF2949433.1 hypothetical protein [Paraglaciecola sp. G1-23]
MSMPSIDLNCVKCDGIWNESITWGPHLYVHEGLKVSINRELVWCKSCDSFTPVELFEQNDVLSQFNEIRQELDRLLAYPILQVISKSRRYRIKDYQNQLSELALKLYIYSKRLGSEKCLSCESTDLIEFKNDYSLDYQSGLYRGMKKTGFSHPNCGGEIIAIPNPIRFNRRYTPKLYDIEGLALPNNDSF